MNVEQRINILEKLGKYILESGEEWTLVKDRAERENNWFTQDAIQQSSEAIGRYFLNRTALENWVKEYSIPDNNPNPHKVGLVMAGNIPLVGFHDMLCIFLSGHRAVMKPSGKDDVLIKHLVAKIQEWAPESNDLLVFSEMLKGCDAYIATGSNNSARYFETYFGKYPSIIRKNRTSVAVLEGNESPEELSALATDVCSYFGLGCRNVTKIYVPEGYHFEPLVRAFDPYLPLADHHKYKNNYDYQLAICIINNKYYMTNGAILLIEDSQLFSPISQLNYEFYTDKKTVLKELSSNESIQCVVSREGIAFGEAQCPRLSDFADGVDTLKFLLKL